MNTDKLTATMLAVNELYIGYFGIKPNDFKYSIAWALSAELISTEEAKELRRVFCFT